MIETDITMLPLWTSAYFLLACTLVMPMIAFLCEAGGQLTKKKFLDKFALQCMRLGNTALVLSLIAITAAGSIYFEYVLLLTQKSLWLKISIASLGMSAFLLFTYQTAWKKLRQAKTLHVFIGACGALLLKTAFWTGCYAYFDHLQQPNLILKHPLFWTGICSWFVLLAASLAFACTSLYLLLRRNRDDFGRDYYKFALSFSLKGALIFFLCHAGTYFLPDTAWLLPLTVKPGLYILILITTSALLTILGWQQVAFNANPVSKKSILILASLTLYCFVCSSLLLQANKKDENCPFRITITDKFSLLQYTP